MARAKSPTSSPRASTLLASTEAYLRSTVNGSFAGYATHGTLPGWLSIAMGGPKKLHDTRALRRVALIDSASVNASRGLAR
jgi:hypothetical protein